MNSFFLISVEQGRQTHTIIQNKESDEKRNRFLFEDCIDTRRIKGDQKTENNNNNNNNSTYSQSETNSTDEQKKISLFSLFSSLFFFALTTKG